MRAYLNKVHLDDIPARPCHFTNKPACINPEKVFTIRNQLAEHLRKKHLKTLEQIAEVMPWKTRTDKSNH